MAHRLGFEQRDLGALPGCNQSGGKTGIPATDYGKIGTAITLKGRG